MAQALWVCPCVTRFRGSQLSPFGSVWLVTFAGQISANTWSDHVRGLYLGPRFLLFHWGQEVAGADGIWFLMMNHQSSSRASNPWLIDQGGIGKTLRHCVASCRNFWIMPRRQFLCASSLRGDPMVIHGLIMSDQFWSLPLAVKKKKTEGREMWELCGWSMLVYVGLLSSILPWDSLVLWANAIRIMRNLQSENRL